MAGTAAYYTFGGLTVDVDEQGARATVSVTVYGVTGANALTKIYNAYHTVVGWTIGQDITDVDVNNPSGLSGVWLRSISASAERDTTDVVNLLYTFASSPGYVTVVETGANLNQVETNKDKDGNAITLKYTYGDEYPDQSLQGTTIEKGVLLSKLVPEKTLRISTRELFDPNDFAEFYVGKLNDKIWRGGDIKTWLCTAITGTSEKNTGYHQNRYEFQYRTDGWKEDITFIDPETGAPVPDAEANKGQKIVELYCTATFDDLPRGEAVV